MYVVLVINTVDTNNSHDHYCSRCESFTANLCFDYCTRDIHCKILNG